MQQLRGSFSERNSVSFLCAMSCLNVMAGIACAIQPQTQAGRQNTRNGKAKQFLEKKIAAVLPSYNRKNKSCHYKGHSRVDFFIICS